MFDLKTYLTALRQLVDDRLSDYLGGDEPATRILQAMSYSVMAGGKRLRPILCIAAAEAVGGDRHVVLPMACALEMIHTYSLIHDDLPAMDDDQTRRGKPTCHKQFDEATAILAGDALLTLAFEILAKAGSQKTTGEEGSRWLAAAFKMTTAVGHEGMIDGQMRDIRFEGRVISQTELETLHRLKTGKLIEASVETGALLCGASVDQRKALLAYAQSIGLAFQVADDVLNIKGDPQRLGKATGTDQQRGKNTYPALIGLAGAEHLASRLVNTALKAIDTFDNKADSLRAIAHYVIERTR